MTRKKRLRDIIPRKKQTRIYCDCKKVEFVAVHDYDGNWGENCTCHIHEMDTPSSNDEVIKAKKVHLDTDFGKTQIAMGLNKNNKKRPGKKLRDTLVRCKVY